MTSEPEASGHMPVVDVDTPFPPMATGGATAASSPVVADDTAPAVRDVIRNILGWRPRVEDPGAFLDALTSSFRITTVEGHIESAYVPRGFAVQADLGSITGGQASLYRRAVIARTETLRILDALTPLRVDADHEDMEAFRGLIRGAIDNAVDELGNPGGPRIPIVDSYLRSLTGLPLPTNPETPVNYPTPDTITGLLGQLRDQFGLTDANVNTIDEEEIRTAFWTLTDLTTDFHKAWRSNRSQFNQQKGGGGFLGTEVIRISRLMDAAADQVLEVEAVLDSALVPLSERQTITLNESENLTLDGLLSWIRTFLVEEGRHIAQDGGRSGIVASLTPTINDIVTSVEANFANRILHAVSTVDIGNAAKSQVNSGIEASPRRSLYITNPGLPIGGSDLPSGMYSARAKIAVAGLRRLLRELAITAQRVSRFPDPVLIDISFTPFPPLAYQGQALEHVRIDIRGLNIRPTQIPAFRIKKGNKGNSETLIVPEGNTPSAGADTISAIFAREELGTIATDQSVAELINRLFDEGQAFAFPANAIDTLVILDGAKGEPEPTQLDEYVITPTKSEFLEATPANPRRPDDAIGLAEATVGPVMELVPNLVEAASNVAEKRVKLARCDEELKSLDKFRKRRKVEGLAFDISERKAEVVEQRRAVEADLASAQVVEEELHARLNRLLGGER